MAFGTGHWSTIPWPGWQTTYTNQWMEENFFLNNSHSSRYFLICVLHCPLADITVEPQSIRMDMYGNSFIWKLVGPSSTYLTGGNYLNARCGDSLVVCSRTHSI